MRSLIFFLLFSYVGSSKDLLGVNQHNYSLALTQIDSCSSNQKFCCQFPFLNFAYFTNFENYNSNNDFRLFSELKSNLNGEKPLNSNIASISSTEIVNYKNSAVFNLGISKINLTRLNCSDTVCIEVYVYNSHSSNINLNSLDLQVNGLNKVNFPINKTITSLDTIIIKLTCQKLNLGPNIIQIEIPDADADLSDNILTQQINIPDPLQLNLLKIDPTHCQSDGSITIQALGGLPPYKFSINNRPNPQTSPFFQLLTTGNYTLTVEDYNHCFAKIAVTVPDSCQIPKNKKFIHNKDAFATGNDCSTLTQELKNQSGSVWYEDKINLTEDFTVNFNFFLGCIDQLGADGIAFVLQPISTAIGVAGGGLGYQNVTPSLAVEFDTWRNPEFNDVGFDHLALMRNGNNNHLSPDNLAGPVPISTKFGNAEDCKYHTAIVKWIAATKTLEVYVECELRIRYSNDIVKNIFGNDPFVYFGFTASTGNSYNNQKICLNYVTASNKLPNYSICEGESIQVFAKPNFTKYLWTPNVGVNNPNISNPIFTPASTTTYYLEITDQCGFKTRDSTTITILNSRIDYELYYTDSCQMNDKAHLRIIPLSNDNSKLYSLDGINFDSILDFDFNAQGYYSIYHKTGNCIATEFIDLKPYTNILKDSIIEIRQVYCSKNGFIKLGGRGGRSPYQFRLNNLSWQDNGDFLNLPAGIYIYEIKDQINCIVSDTIEIIDIKSTAKIKVDSTDFEVTCCSPTTYLQVSSNPNSQKNIFALDQQGWNNQSVFNNLSQGMHTLRLQDENGCITDSLNFEVFDFRKDYDEQNNQIICAGDKITVGNKIYNQTGNYVDSLKSQYCCDSIIHTQLLVHPSYFIQNDRQICEGSFVEVGQNKYSSSGLYTDTLISSFSCDSIIITNLKVSKQFIFSNSIAICEGSTIQVGNSIYSKTGSYIDSLRSSSSCDSIIITQLQVKPVFKKQLNFSICPQDSIDLNGNYYKNDTQVVITYKTINNCDSILELNIHLLPRQINSDAKIICEGESVTIGNNTYNTSGIYIDSFQNQYGCDSIWITNLKLDSVRAELNIDSILCYQSNDGRVSIQINNGIQDFLIGLNDSVQLKNTFQFNNLSPGQYKIFIKDSANCKTELSFSLNEAQRLDLTLDKEIFIQAGTDHILNPLINFIPKEINWTPSKGLSCTDCLNPICNILEDTEYELSIVDSNDCVITSSIKIKLNRDYKIFVPNIFSPNGDGANDVFYVISDQGIDDIERMEIFDRWGSLVYLGLNLKVNNPTNGWDGNFNQKKLNPGVYSYSILAKKSDGSLIRLSGDVTLIR